MLDTHDVVVARPPVGEHHQFGRGQVHLASGDRAQLASSEGLELEVDVGVLHRMQDEVGLTRPRFLTLVFLGHLLVQFFDVSVHEGLKRNSVFLVGQFGLEHEGLAGRVYGHVAEGRLLGGLCRAVADGLGHTHNVICTLVLATRNIDNHGLGLCSLGVVGLGGLGELGGAGVLLGVGPDFQLGGDGIDGAGQSGNNCLQVHHLGGQRHQVGRFVDSLLLRARGRGALIRRHDVHQEGQILGHRLLLRAHFSLEFLLVGFQLHPRG